MRGGESAGRVLIILLSLILIIPLASNSASADSDDLELVITFEEPNFDSSWYNENETLLMDIKIHNSASSTQSVEYNPSCPVEIEMLDGNGVLFSSLNEHRACQQQWRAIDIPAGQTRNLDSFEWNWQNSTGETINGGFVTINFNFESGSVVHSQTLEFQQSPVTIDGLMLEVNTASAPGENREEFFTGEKIYSHLSLRNVDNVPLLFDIDEGCRVTLQASSLDSSLPTIMTDLSCGGEGSIGVGESLSLGWLDWDFTQAGEQLLPGPWTLDIGITGVTDLSGSVFATFVGDNEMSGTTPLEMEINILGDVESDGIITDAETIQITTDLINIQNIPVDIQFNNSCLVSIHLISEQGSIVSDTNIAEECVDEYSEMKISPSTIHQLDQRLWQMSDQFGCELDDGDYMMVVAIPEFSLFREFQFTYDGSNSGLECRASMQDASLVDFNIIDLTINNADTEQESVTFQLRLDNPIDIDVYWPQDCQLEFTLQKVGASQPHQVWLEQCGSGSGVMGTIPAGHGISYDPFTVDFAGLNAGTWRLTAHTTGTPSFTTQWAHTWNPPTESVQEDETEDDTTDEVDELPDVVEQVPTLSWMAEGNWEYVTTETGGCWILIDLDGVEHAYTSTSIESWKPRTNYRGAYWVEESMESTPACVVWQSHIVVDDVLGEAFVEPISEEKSTEVDAGAPIISIPAATPAIVTVIASTGLLALLAGALVQVEWIRLPATKYGLFLLGMVRKNKEKGGEYQRGRIVAYIELHRGIHFRALLAALAMSNGQLTHHLSVLEGDEAIWRRKDGRKVRYYPASIDSSTSNDDLPVPVLTPDPNSLQGRIMQILDIHENEILNLSQKELSDKLETSQQLVSYHLKSLENWGLVEKERVALRYRYRLTDRALILLNSTELPSLRDEG